MIDILNHMTRDINHWTSITIIGPQSIENVYIGVNMYALGDSLRNEPFFIVLNNLHFTALVKRNDLFKFETISNTCRFSV